MNLVKTTCSAGHSPFDLASCCIIESAAAALAFDESAKPEAYPIEM